MGKLGFWFLNHFIPYYGLMIVIGLLTACFIAYIQTRKYHLDWNDFIILSAISGLGIIIGAKILYLIVSIPVIDFERLNEFSYFNSLMSGGFVFYGGVLGGLFSLYLCKKALKINITPYLQYCTACLPIAHGFGRIGCFLVGCCYGIPHEGLFSVTYQQSLYAPDNIPVFAVQLVEAFGDFLIGAILLSRSRKWSGISAFSFYITAYAAMRFILEYFRGDLDRGFVGILSTSQFISMILFAICLTIFVKDRKKI